MLFKVQLPFLLSDSLGAPFPLLLPTAVWLVGGTLPFLSPGRESGHGFEAMGIKIYISIKCLL
jgi:hypothetical protein